MINPVSYRVGSIAGRHAAQEYGASQATTGFVFRTERTRVQLSSKAQAQATGDVDHDSDSR